VLCNSLPSGRAIETIWPAAKVLRPRRSMLQTLRGVGARSTNLHGTALRVRTAASGWVTTRNSVAKRRVRASRPELAHSSDSAL
jgi:hypothetical protein